MRRIEPTHPFVPFAREDVERSIPELFERQVARVPERLAVRSPGHELTYGRLNALANRIAHAVLAGCRPGTECVAILIEHGAPVVAAILGVLKTGRTYVPLDPAYPKERLEFMLAESGADMLVTNASHRAEAERLAGDRVRFVDIDALDPELSESNPRVKVAPTAGAYLLFTSGSTGKPKGVSQPHRNVLLEVMNYTNAAHLAEDDRMLLVSSTSFADSVRTLYGGLLNGAALMALDVRRDGIGALDGWLSEQHVTVYRSVPTLFRHFASALPEGRCFDDVRLVYFAGEPVMRRDVDLARAHFRRECLVMNGIGTTETLTYRWFIIDHDTPLEGASVPVGYPLEEKEALLLDDERNPVGAGEVGEIAVRSAYMSPGYWRRPDLTAERFLPDPDGGDRRVYLTGDLAVVRPDGCMVHRGRKDFQIKVRGHRVELAEIETALTDLPFIEDALVTAGVGPSGDTRVVAYVVPGEGRAPTVSELRRSLVDELPDYMVPAAFVVLGALPLLPNGKVNRRALPSPDDTRPYLDVDFLPPSSEVERAVAQIWAEVLEVSGIGVNDPFLELGGDSILASRVTARVLDLFGVHLRMVDLLAAGTVGKMAQAVLDGETAPGQAQRVAEAALRVAAMEEGAVRRVLSEGGSEGARR